MRLESLTQLLLCGALAACTAIAEPLGDEPATLQPHQWEGYWIVGDGPHAGDVYYVVVTDGAAGSLELSRLGKTQPEGQAPSVALDRTKLMVRRTGNAMFGNLPFDADDGSKVFAFFALRKQDDQVVLWMPDDECIRALVARGALLGRRVGHDLLLDRVDAAKTVSWRGWECRIFQWDAPIVLRRLTH